jgi:HK97 family phage prohead protease
MDRKTYSPELLKMTGEAGSFRAVFSLFNTPDSDNDVTLPGAFENGAETRIAQWGHAWNAPVIGRGVIQSDAEKAWVDGQFFLNMQAGRETYEAVKGSRALQQWSYAYDLLDWEHGDFEGRPVRLIKRVRVHEVSPVLLGSQSRTYTDSIKALKAGARNNAADVQRLTRLGELLTEAQTLLAELTDAPADPDPEPKGQTLVDLRREIGALMSESGNGRVEEIRRELAAIR